MNETFWAFFLNDSLGLDNGINLCCSKKKLGILWIVGCDLAHFEGNFCKKCKNNENIDRQNHTKSIFGFLFFEIRTLNFKNSL